VRPLVENTRRILDVAQIAGAGDDTPQEFALAIRHDGGMHFIMETPFSFEGAASYLGARSVWRIRRSRESVSVEAFRAPNPADFLRDQPRYRITSPVLTSCTVSAGTAGESVSPILRA
jgi:hypothetical protein